MPVTLSLPRRPALLVFAVIGVCGCDAPRAPERTEFPEEPSPAFRNVEIPTAYVGDDACVTCHDDAATAYRAHAMARSFHGWTRETRIETTLDQPMYHAPTGLWYSVGEDEEGLYQEEFITGSGGSRIHELRRRIDYVMGSGNVARTYFTEENGRLFQLPLTWYRDQGWDFSPGYEINNARFDRLMPDRCVACHGSYPDTLPFLEGKYETLRPGIGCERCHGPGALHVSERSTAEPVTGGFDDTIVNPIHLPFQRRLDVCEQCHVHTPVSVLREGRDPFGYLPSQPLRDHIALFKTTGSIDIVSHADRLRQSACFIATRPSDRPLECSTCHNPHQPTSTPEARNQPCLTCHAPGVLTAQLPVAAQATHGVEANCVGCHMPAVAERTVPHGTFTDHWIRVVAGPPEPSPSPATAVDPIEPYFARDRTGPAAAVYRAMGRIVYGTLAPDPGSVRSGADALAAALAADTMRADAYFLLGLAYSQLGMPDDAARAFERSLRLNPDRPQRLDALARAYRRSARDPDEVAALYENALALQPAHARIRADYARFLQALGRRDQAETEYRAALAEQPSLAVGAFNLGTLMAERGRLDEAASAFRQAVTLDPSLAEALSPLLLVRVAGSAVVDVRTRGSPLGNLPLRARGPRGMQLVVGGRRRIVIRNVAPGATLFVQEPDGAPVQTLRAADDGTAVWDLLTEWGEPIGGGLYRVQGGPGGAAPVFFGVMRLGAP